MEKNGGLDPKELLNHFFESEACKKYFCDSKYSFPTTRHEAWFLASAISNLAILDKLESIERILQKKVKKSIIIDSKDKKDPVSIRKKRRTV